jgi:phospholipid/cholesterol/gamma-HCH transport system substrate-binding protein
MLQAKLGEPLPVIYADPGGSGMFAGVADAAGNANALLVRLNNLVANNEDTVRHTLTNLEAFSTMMNERKDDLGAAVQDARTLMKRLVDMSNKIDAAVDRIAGTTSENPDSAVSQLQQAATSFRQLAEKLDHTLGDRADGLTQQAQRGLREFELFMKDGRRLADSLDRVVQKVERNPSGFLLGQQTSPKY